MRPRGAGCAAARNPPKGPRPPQSHGEARGLMNTGIEIRQDLISDPAGEKAWAERLARILGEVEAALRERQLIYS